MKKNTGLQANEIGTKCQSDDLPYFYDIFKSQTKLICSCKSSACKFWIWWNFRIQKKKYRSNGKRMKTLQKSVSTFCNSLWSVKKLVYIPKSYNYYAGQCSSLSEVEKFWYIRSAVYRKSLGTFDLCAEIGAICFKVLLN